MYRFTLPLTDVRLIFTPPLESMPGWLQVLLMLFALALTGGLLIWLYSYEIKLVRPITAMGLLAMRSAVVVLLFFVCMQPVVSRGATEKLAGRVVVAVDRSDSMNVSDPQRDGDEKLRLARGLGLANDIVNDKQIDDWLNQYKDQKRVQFPATQAGELERNQHNQACARVDALSRLQMAHQVLARDKVGLLRELQKRHRVEVLGFTQELGELTPEEIAALGNPPDSSQAGRSFTDIRLPLSHSLERSGPERGKVLGIILLTDGQHNWGPLPSQRAGELGKLGVPIFPVPLGARRPPADIAVTTVQSPTSVFKNSEVPVEARIVVHGMPERELVVTLQRDGQPPLEERIQHDGKTQNYTVRFQPKMEEVGTKTLKVTVKNEREELRADNNSRPVIVNVADDKAKVLLIDGEARWEFHYLASALNRDQSMQVKTVVYSQPRLDAAVSEEDLQAMGYPSLKLPTEPDALNGYDCIILGDVSPEQLPLADRTRLENYVAERGGTLVFLAGKRSMPLGFGATNSERENDPLFRLLPVQEPREVKPVDGFPVTLTAEGRLSAFLQMEATAEQSDQRWANLPRHFWGLIGKAKPGATTLAWVNAAATVKKDAKEQGENERNNALIVRQNYGFGRVLFVGLDSTWRWRYRAGDTYHHRFWGQVIRWAASDKPLITGNEFVRFGTREPMYRAGQEIDVIVRFSEAARSLGPDALAGARLFRLKEGMAEENAGLVPLSRRENRPREMEAKLRDLTPGTYALELAIPDLADQLAPAGANGRNGKMRAVFHVDPPDSSEMIDLATNRPLLEDLATRSGGEVVEPEDAGKLVERMQKALAERHYRTETQLWRSAWTLILFLLLLTIEWVWRKWVGLP